MFKFLILMMALVGVVAGAPSVALRKALDDWENYGLYQPMKPERMFQMVSELKRHYEGISYSHTISPHDDWTKGKMPILYRLGNISTRNCERLDDYNKDSMEQVENFGAFPSAVTYLNYYRAKQNELCH